METPFNMIINGMTGCGKTYYLLNFLERNYMNHFEYIVIICLTFSWNKTYQGWKFLKDSLKDFLKDLITIECDQVCIDLIIKYTVKIFQGTNTLIILDDCACNTDVNKRFSKLVRLGFGARHGLSTK